MERAVDSRSWGDREVRCKDLGGSLVWTGASGGRAAVGSGNTLNLEPSLVLAG